MTLRGHVVNHTTSSRWVEFDNPEDPSGARLSLTVPAGWEWLLPVLAAAPEMERLLLEAEEDPTAVLRQRWVDEVRDLLEGLRGATV